MTNLFQINKFRAALLTTAIITTFGSHAFADSGFIQDPANIKHNLFNAADTKLKPIKHRSGRSLKANTYTGEKSDMTRIHVRKIQIEGANAENEAQLHTVIDSMASGLTTLSAVDALAAKITKFYQDKGELLTLAYVPKQYFKDGVVRINVLEGAIRDVVVEGDVQSPVLKAYIDKILELEPLTKDKLVRYLHLMNKIPGYEVEYAFEPIPMDSINTKEGKIADLILVVTRTHGKVMANIDNYGTKDLGRNQGSIGGQLMSPFKHDESLVGFVGTSNKPNKLKIATVGYKKILNSEGTSLQVLASYATNSANKVSTAPTTKHDKGTMIRATVSHYPVLSNKTSFKIEGGAQNRTQDVFNGATKQSKYHVLSALVSSEIQHKDGLGGFTSFTPTIFKGISGASKVTMYDPTVKKYDDNFTMFNGNFWHDHPLVGPVSLYISGNGQYSSNELPLEEKFIVGGIFNGRGYKTALVSANKGGGVTAELRLTKKMDAGILNLVQPYAFYDTTSFSKTQALTNVSTLSSAGAGLRFTLFENAEFTLEAAQPLKKNIVIAGVTTKNDTRYSFIVNKTFSW